MLKLYWKEWCIIKKNIFIIVIITILLINIPNFISYAGLYSFDKNKETSTETEVVTFIEIVEVLNQQSGLGRELRNTYKYRLVSEEVFEAYDEVRQYELLFIKSPDIKSIKVKWPITTYKDGDKTIKFVSGKGEIIEKYEE